MSEFLQDLSAHEATGELAAELLAACCEVPARSTSVPATSVAVRSLLDDALTAERAALVERSRVVDGPLDARLLVTSPR